MDGRSELVREGAVHPQLMYRLTHSFPNEFGPTELGAWTVGANLFARGRYIRSLCNA